MRHPLVLVALTLGACTAPSTADMSNLAHLQPTPEFCSQKLALDPVKKLA